jgi:hypothetical protein
MDNKHIKVGQLVTWGSGRPRGKIMEYDATRDFPILVEMIGEVTGVCGRTFAGSAWFSPDDIRLVS